MVIEVFSPEETQRVAHGIALKAGHSSVYCLTGGLGAGKTVFAKGFAKGLGILQDITSPTFSIINEYRGRLNLYHFDVYRINSIYEMEDTGYEDYFYGDGVCLIEWAEMIKELLPQDAIYINIEKDIEKGEDYRRITIKAVDR